MPIQNPMACHEVKSLMVRYAAKFPRHILQDVLFLIVINPIGEIMQSAGIAVNASIPVAESLKFLSKRVERQTIHFDAAAKCQDIFHKRHAIETVEIDDQLFRSGLFQRVLFVRRAEELSPHFPDDFPNWFFDEFMLEGVGKDPIADYLIPGLAKTYKAKRNQTQ